MNVGIRERWKLLYHNRVCIGGIWGLYGEFESLSSGSSRMHICIKMSLESQMMVISGSKQLITSLVF